MWTAILDTVCLKYFLPLVMFFFLVFGFDKLQLWWLPLGFSFSFWFLFLTNFNSADCHFETLYHSRRFIPSSDQRQPFTPESHQSLQITLKSHQNHTKLFKSRRNQSGITPVFPLPPFNFHYTFFMGCCGIFLLTVIQGYWTKEFFCLFGCFTVLWNPALKLWIEY